MGRDDERAVTAADVAGEVVGETDGLRTVAAELPPFARWNVLVAFDDSDDARRVIQQLEASGVEGAHLSYLALQPADGAAATGAAAPGELDHDTRVDTDARTARSVAKGAAIGGSTGAVGGALAGMALLLIPGVGTLAGIGVLGAAIGGAAAGGDLGLVWGGYRRLGASPAWEHTFASVDAGCAVVGVHTDDEGELRRALRHLPVEGRHAFDAEGAVVEVPVA